MCGIAGLLLPGAGGQTDRVAAARQSVTRMIECLHHRGPDGCGLEVASGASDPLVVLGHTRLAIIDPSPTGRQPMVSADGSTLITFNGEIYNFRALRSVLGDDGWRSHSDTEVLLRAYARWGRECLAHLRGMFAFALWDAQRRELFLARDRLGIKPVYYACTEDGGFVFASEVRALLAGGLVAPRLDRVALSEYLAYQSLPAPRTLVDGVRSLQPGCWLRVDASGGVTHGCYWDLLGQVGPPADTSTLEDSRRRVAELLRESVALHLVSDVPVGAFLSGGIDSTAVVALMRDAGVVPRTFSVGFHEQAYDESVHAQTVAACFRTDHSQITLRERDVLDQIPEALDAMDQPTGDGVNTFVVSRAVHAAGIKVALSGLGGDELFAGYPSFMRLQRAAAVFRAWGHMPPLVRTLAARGVRILGRSSVAATKAAAMVASNGQLAHLYPLTRQVLSTSQRRALLAEPWAGPNAAAPDPYVALLEPALRGRPQAGTLTAISYAEARTYMHDVLLRDTDQMSMAHSLEVRVPLLDHCLIEYLMRLPDRYKQPAGTPKRLLVDSLDGLLPTSIVHRPKQGFALPFDPWLRGPLREFCATRLGLDGLAGRGILQPDVVWDLWTGFLDRHPAVSWSRVWILVVLEAWLERNGL